MSELLPCPFCGGPATLEEVRLGDASNWSVGCLEHDGEPLCMGYQSLTQFARKVEAVEAWNLRAPTMRDNGWLGPVLHDKVSALTEARKEFDVWWAEDGCFIDPDTDDVPWFDKRKELCWCAFRDAIAAWNLRAPPASPTGRQLDPGKRDDLPPIVSEGVGGLVEAMTELADAVFGRTAGDCPNVYADYDKLCALEESTRSALSKATGEGG